MIFALVSVASLPMVLASVPRSELSNDTAIYQNLHEIKVTQTKSLNFDSDINRLSAQEKSYHETLPMRISAPMDRVLKTPYRSGGFRKSRKSMQQMRFRK